MQEAGANQLPTQVEPPNGMYSARVDDKGRLKLPVCFQEYFGALAEKKLYVTSLDRRTGQIYTAADWRLNKKFLAEYRTSPEKARQTAFNANDLGADSEMDGQGRILLPPEMRRELGIENQTVRLFAERGHIELYSEAVYQETRGEATQSARANRESLERDGLM